MREEILINYQNIRLHGHVDYEEDSKAWVIFAHGSGSSRHSSRNNWVAGQLNRKGFATMLFDLLTEEEDLVYENRFDLPLLAQRLMIATDWLMKKSFYQDQPIAYFGASTGAGAALIAAANISPSVPLFTVISRGGRPDLAREENLKKISLPVLLIVGDLDFQVITLNQMAHDHLSHSKIVLVSGATHLFEEPGALDQVVKLANEWLEAHLPMRSSDGLFI